jgi:hypothetical protein
MRWLRGCIFWTPFFSPFQWVKSARKLAAIGEWGCRRVGAAYAVGGGLVGSGWLSFERSTNHTLLEGASFSAAGPSLEEVRYIKRAK